MALERFAREADSFLLERTHGLGAPVSTGAHEGVVHLPVAVPILRDQTVELTSEDFKENSIDIISMLVKANLVESRSDARRAIQQGGVSVSDNKITDITTTFDVSAFTGDGLIIKRGKKKFAKLIMQ